MKRVELKSDVTGNVWKCMASAGATVKADEPLLIIESMKMEIPVCSDVECEVVEILVDEGEAVKEGQAVAIVNIR